MAEEATERFENLNADSLPEAADLIASSWKENKDQPLDYNASFLSSCYEYPHTSPELSPAIRRGHGLSAFVSGFPRRVRLDGEELRLVVATFFTVAVEAKGQGLGKKVWAECLRRACEAGFDGAIHYCVDGYKSNLVTMAAAREAGFDCRRVFSVKYLIRTLKPELGDPAPPDDGHLSPLFLECVRAVQDRLRFARLWSREEAEWECRGRYGALAESLERGGRWGMITGYRLHIADQRHTPVVFIENLLWDCLQDPERRELLDRFLRKAARSAEIAVVPLWGYTDPAPFQAARFRQSTRMMHAYLTFWNGRQAPDGDEFNPMYIDVF
jgi:hypothetical protein